MGREQRALPGPDRSLSSSEFSEACAAALQLPSPACQDELGQVVRGRQVVNLYGEEVQAAALPGMLLTGEDKRRPGLWIYASHSFIRAMLPRQGQRIERTVELLREQWRGNWRRWGRWRGLWCEPLARCPQPPTPLSTTWPSPEYKWQGLSWAGGGSYGRRRQR